MYAEGTMRIHAIDDGFAETNYQPTRIKIIGVGGGGGNAVDNLIKAGLKDVEFVAINTDLQALTRSNADTKLPIGAKVTKGLGAGGIPTQGEAAAEESAQEIKELVQGAHMVFVTGGMGGGTGTGGVPVVARIAREMGILTVGVVTRPFNVEGKRKQKFADEGIEKLRGNVDSIIIINNQDVMDENGQDLPIMEAFSIVDDVLVKSVFGISEIITKTEHINIDFADIQTIMRNQGEALLGIGVASGANRAVDAATSALNHPMLKNLRLDGAQNVLVSVVGDASLTVKEYDDILHFITVGVKEDAMVISGFMVDSDFQDRIKVTVVITGFDPALIAAGHIRKEAESAARDVVPYEEWVRMQEGITRGSATQFLSGRNGGDTDLGIPTVLRTRKEMD
jgi:cell division protein FtsZ